MSVDLTKYIASIPGFPKEGIVFRDVTPIVNHPEAFKEVTTLLAEYAKKVNADMIAGPESRGFIFGCPVSVELGIGFIPVRKPGKLPRETISETYSLATGGSAKATAKLIERLGGVVAGVACIIELEGLPGRKTLEGYDVYSILTMSDC